MRGIVLDAAAALNKAFRGIGGCKGGDAIVWRVAILAARPMPTITRFPPAVVFSGGPSDAIVPLVGVALRHIAGFPKVWEFRFVDCHHSNPRSFPHLTHAAAILSRSPHASLGTG